MKEVDLRIKVREFCRLQKGCGNCPLDILKDDVGKCPNDLGYEYTDEVKNKILEIITVKPKEEINHPSRYANGKYECIDVMLDIFGKEAVKHFCLLNAFKYIWRQEQKGGAEDIKKAVWYLNEYIELEESEDKT